MEKTIAGLFLSRLDAEIALRGVRANGFDVKEASILEKSSSTYDYNHVNDAYTDDGAMATALYDGGAALISGIGSGEVQALGQASARGPVAEDVNGHIGFTDILLKMGIPKDCARQYLNELKSGKTLWTMKANSADIPKLSNSLRTGGAVIVNVH